MTRSSRSQKTAVGEFLSMHSTWTSKTRRTTNEQISKDSTTGNFCHPLHQNDTLSCLPTYLWRQYVSYWIRVFGYVGLMNLKVHQLNVFVKHYIPRGAFMVTVQASNSQPMDQMRIKSKSVDLQQRFFSVWYVSNYLKILRLILMN